MDDNEKEQTPGLPAKPPSRELESALRWLEELSARDKAPGEPKLSAEDAAVLSSPFRGLLDVDDSELPDWLREVPAAGDVDLLSGDELESRLDWLAKMAQRESIEELPTLEWRRFTDSIVSQEEISPTLQTEDLLAGTELSSPFRETIDTELPPPEQVAPSEDLEAAMAWIEAWAASQDGPIEDLPSVADRALASKLLADSSLGHDTVNLGPLPPELAAVDDFALLGTPPSEDDPADTIVLIETMRLEHGLPAEVEELPVVAGLDDSFVAEQMAVIEVIGEVDESSAEQVAELDESSAERVADEVSTRPLSFTEAMAYLDELAVQETTSDVAPVDTIATEEALFSATDGPAVDELVESLAAIPLLDDVGQASASVVVFADEDTVDSTEEQPRATSVTDIEIRLRSLDLLALPAGRSIEELDGLFAPYPPNGTSDHDELPSILDWLEAALSDSGSHDLPGDDLVDEELIRLMPEDPDAALAWLEQMAYQEEGVSGVIGSNGEGQIAEHARYTGLTLAAVDAPIDELADADLLDMPEDPDEVIAWLEGMAADGVAPTAVESSEEMPTNVLPEIVSEPAAKTGSAKSRKRSKKVAEESTEVIDAVSQSPTVAASTPSSDDRAVADIPQVDNPVDGDNAAMEVDAVGSEAEASTSEDIGDTTPESKAKTTRRAKKRKGTDVGSEQAMPVLEAPAEVATIEQPETAPTVAEVPATRRRAMPVAAAWVDLLKPLDRN